jgi:tight adherence protein B
MTLLVLLSATAAGSAVLLGHATVRRARRLAGMRVRSSRVDLVTAVRELRWAREREARRSDRALPDSLERVARALRSGASLPVALAAGQPERPHVLANDWRRLTAEAGDVGVLTAATRWRERRASRAVSLTVAALAVASDVGGPQARALDTVAATLRQRIALEAEVHALGAQSRASAGVIALAPLGFAMLASGLEPAYLSFLLGTPAGLLMLSTGVALQLVGLWWMARLSRIEV